MSNVFSTGLYQEQESISVTRNLTEEQQKTAPLISLADKEQLQDLGPALEMHESRVKAFRKGVAASMPPSLEDKEIGGVREAETTRIVSDRYVSVTSGYNITELERELLTKWRYQRYNGQDTAEMKALKDSLKDLTSGLALKAEFSSAADVSIQAREMLGKYRTLIGACERYLDTHQSPRSIAGRYRKRMAEKLMAASYAELDMLEDSALCCYREAAERKEEGSPVSFTWNEILHEGRIRDVHAGQNIEHLAHPADHMMELRHLGTHERDLLTVAGDGDELKECRKFVAVSRLAEKLECGELAGGGSMNTRMTTMIVQKEALTGVITEGVTKTTERQFRNAQTTPRPGEKAIGAAKTVKGTDYRFDEMKLKILDYLVGAGARKETEFPSDKEQTSGFLILGSIQLPVDSTAARSFGNEGVEMPDLNGAEMEQEFAEKILSLKAEDLPELFFGMLDKEQISGVAERLSALKKAVEEHKESFKTREEVDREVAEATKPVPLKLPEVGKLMPLSRLAEDVKAAKGKNAETLNGLSKGFAGCIANFASFRSGIADFTKGKDAVLAQVDRQLLAVDDLRDHCRTYLKQSKDDDDAANRLAVSKLLAAAEHQAYFYKLHVENICDWYEKNAKAFPEWSLSLSYEELFNESLVNAEHNGSTGAFSEDEMYRYVDLSMEELCEKTETTSIDSLESRLSGSLKAKEEAGKTNSDEITAIHDALEDIKKMMGKSTKLYENNPFFMFRRLWIACDDYQKKQKKGLLPKGLLSGSDRMDMLKEIESMMQNEFTKIGSFDDKGEFTLDEKRLDAYRKRIASRKKIPEGEVVFGDVFMQIKMDSLMGIEKDLLRGVKRKKLVEESKEIAKKAKAASRTGSKKKTDKTEDRPEREDPKVMEKRLSDMLGQPALHELLAALGKELGSKDENGREITEYFKILQALMEYKDQPIFSIYECDEVAGKGDMERRLHNSIIGRANEMYRRCTLLSGWQKDYFARMGKKLFGGIFTRTGNARQDIMIDTAAAYSWELDRFTEKDSDGTERIMDGPLFAALKKVLESGKELKEVTLTDLTNQVRLDAIEEKVAAPKKDEAPKKKGSPRSKKK